MSTSFQYVLSVLIFITMLYPTLSHAGNPAPQWLDGTLSPDDIQKIKLGEKTSKILFNAIDDVDFKPINTNGLLTKIKFKRRIFNDPLNESLSVVDSFGLELEKRFSDQFEVGGWPDAGLGFYLSIGGDAEFTNIRQVEKPNLNSISMIKDRVNEISSTDWFNQFVEKSVQTSNTNGQTKTLCPFKDDDLVNRLRFCDFLNRITSPFRYPLNKSDFEELSDEEITSFTGSGYIRFGVSANWGIIPSDPIGWVRAGLSVSTFLKGAYRISVYKESSQYAQVKVARIKERGTGISVGGSQTTNAFDGIFFLEQLSGELSIVPFNISRANTHRDLFEVTYRFDMTSEQGQMAFKRAVRGDFLFAEKATVDGQGQPTRIQESGVERLLIESSQSQSTTLSSYSRLSFVFKQQQSSGYETIETQLQHPDGKVDYFQSLARTSSEWKALFAWYEKFIYKITMSANLTQLRRGQDDQNALRLTVEGEIRDSHTSFREWTSYILEIENSVGIANQIPRAPMANQFIGIGKPKKLGHSQLYYSFNLGKDDVLKFLDANEAERWATMEKAFGVSQGAWASPASRFLFGLVTLPLSVLNIPLFIAGAHLRHGSILYHAGELESQWQTATEQPDLESRLKKLGRLFYDSRYGYEVVRLIRNYLDGSQIEYSLTTSNQLLGEGNLYGQSLLTAEDQTHFIEEMSADEKRVWEINTEISNIRIQRNSKIKVEFELNSDANSVYLQFLGRNSSGEITRSNSIYIKSDTQTPLKAGRNSLEIDNSYGDFNSLSDTIRYSSRFDVKASVSPQGIQWGPEYEQTFRRK